jgi:hypothetical protein
LTDDPPHLYPPTRAPQGRPRLRALRETTLVPGRAGRKPYRITRTLETFYGSGMMLAARATLDRLTCRTKPKPTKRGIYARSLTIAEYDEVMRRTRYQGSY